MTAPELTVRQRTPQQGERKPTYRAETARAPGPLVMGDAQDGSYPALFSANWMLEWPKGGGLRLYQQQGAEWAEVQPGQAFPPMPDTARHISLAFDQSARHVVAWEDAGQLYVRQWSNTQQVYAYVGPFAGVDPLLFMDAATTREAPDSDVLLLYLTPDRTELRYRLQRDAYGIERPIATGLNAAVLDQVVIHPYAAEIRGENAGEDFTVWLGFYPMATQDAMTGGAQLAGGELFETQILRDFAEAMTGGAQLQSGQLEVSDLNPKPTEAVTGTARLASGDLPLTVVSYSTGKEAMTGSAALTTSVLGLNFATTRTEGMTGTAALVGGTYGP